MSEAAQRSGDLAADNARWLSALRQNGESGRAAEELREYLRNGIAKALRAQQLGAADLEDCAQDAFVGVFERLDTFRGDSRFTTWAMAVALRTAFSMLRRRRHQNLRLEELELEAADPAPDAARILERRDLLEALRRAIYQELTERQRFAILGELLGTPTAVMAERLRISSNAFYKLHHDARKKLGRALNKAGFSDEDVREELMEATKRT